MDRPVRADGPVAWMGMTSGREKADSPEVVEPSDVLVTKRNSPHSIPHNESHGQRANGVSDCGYAPVLCVSLFKMAYHTFHLLTSRLVPFGSMV